MDIWILGEASDIAFIIGIVYIRVIRQIFENIQFILRPLTTHIALPSFRTFNSAMSSERVRSLCKLGDKTPGYVYECLVRQQNAWFSKKKWSLSVYFETKMCLSIRLASSHLMEVYYIFKIPILSEIPL